MVSAVVLIVVAVLCIVAARAVALWWAQQPLGAVHLDGRVELRVGARQVDGRGRCGNSGELAVAGGRLVMTVGDRLVMSVPVDEVGASVRLSPRPIVWLFGDGWGRSVVVDRARPVPVLVGRIGLDRQTTTAQVVVGVLGQAVRANAPLGGNLAIGNPADVGDPDGAAAEAQLPD